ncbi:MAG: SDR family oxidoreductase [Christensenellaceae bacterium]|nr:SDR family oxidoreductase [Christensenellaceae bacterium]
MRNKVIWITGASSGLGYYCAKELYSRGYKVVGGARSFNAEKHEVGFSTIYLDVSDEKSCDYFVKSALKIYGEPYALLNGAGVLHLSPGECIDTSDLQKIMDVNFLGMHRITKRVLPYMRKNNAGHIINFSSINGLFASPYQGAYSAAKHAIEGFSEALYMELSPHNIHVTLLEPGDHRGGKAAYRLTEQNPPECYKDSYNRVVDKINHDEASGSDPSVLAKKVAKFIERKNPPFRYVIAMPSQRLSVVLQRILPAKFFLNIISKYYGV